MKALGKGQTFFWGGGALFNYKSKPAFPDLKGLSILVCDSWKELSLTGCGTGGQSQQDTNGVPRFSYS